MLQVLRLGSAPPWICHGSDFTPSTLVRKKMLHATSAQTSCAEAWQWRSYCNVHVYLSRYTDAVSSPSGYHGKHHRLWPKHLLRAGCRLRIVTVHVSCLAWESKPAAVAQA